MILGNCINSLSALTILIPFPTAENYFVSYTNLIPVIFVHRCFEYETVGERQNRHMSKLWEQTNPCTCFEQLSSFFLSQRRWTWQHDNIINFTIKQINKKKYEEYADVDWHKYNNGSTIPPNILVTAHCPDIIVIDQERKKKWKYLSWRCNLKWILRGIMKGNTKTIGMLKEMSLE